MASASGTQLALSLTPDNPVLVEREACAQAMCRDCARAARGDMFHPAKRNKYRTWMHEPFDKGYGSHLCDAGPIHERSLTP
jgi:hypothetical protein